MSCNSDRPLPIDGMKFRHSKLYLFFRTRNLDALLNAVTSSLSLMYTQLFIYLDIIVSTLSIESSRCLGGAAGGIEQTLTRASPPNNVQAFKYWDRYCDLCRPEAEVCDEQCSGVIGSDIIFAERIVET